MASTNSERRLVWIDCEMTGLDVDHDVIIEIFCIVTDGDLKVLDEEGWGVVVGQSKETMDKMDSWCTHTHGQSGLTAAVLSSSTSAAEASTGLLAYIQRHVPQPRTALLAGNSVHADKAFLRKEPYNKIIDYLHYRILDVSTIKEAVKMWCPEEIVKNVPTKRNLHQAKQDILESIEEARFYREVLFQRAER